MRHLDARSRTIATFVHSRQESILKLLSSNSLETFHHNGWQLTVPVLEAIATHQPQIKDLALGHSGDCLVIPGSIYGLLTVFDGLDFDLLERELITTLKTTRQLKTLLLRQNSFFSPIAPPGARTHFVTDETLQTLAKSCSDLRQLELFDCAHITKAGITSLAKGCLNLETLSEPRTLLSYG